MSLAAVQARLAAACTRVARDPGEVQLIAITKGHGPTEIRRELLEHGHVACGENRIQEWQAKASALPEAEWHFIGTLQRNKVKYCLPFTLIHSLNSERLADALQRQGEKQEYVFRVLVEVNVAGEASKQGVGPDAATDLVRYAQTLPNLDVRGLMTMAPYAEDPEAARPYFRALRELRDALGLSDLSMGMSGDFEIAVEEGATMVRVGSAIFSHAPADQTS